MKKLIALVLGTETVAAAVIDCSDLTYHEDRCIKGRYYRRTISFSGSRCQNKRVGAWVLVRDHCR